MFDACMKSFCEEQCVLNTVLPCSTVISVYNSIASILCNPITNSCVIKLLSYRLFYSFVICVLFIHTDIFKSIHYASVSIQITLVPSWKSTPCGQVKLDWRTQVSVQIAWMLRAIGTHTLPNVAFSRQKSHY